MKVPSHAITAMVCLGQSFIADQSIPLTFLSRIRTVSTFISNAFVRPKERQVYDLPNFLILSGSDVKNNGITEARFMLDQINEHLEESKLVTPITTWNYTTTASNSQSYQVSFNVILEEESRNTLENIYYCYELLEKFNINKVYLVTSDFHVFRSLLLAKMIWNQPPNRVKREVIPVIAHSPIIPHKSHLIAKDPKLLQSLKSFVSRITSFLSFLIHPTTFLQRHSSNGINSCRTDHIRSYYRPWEQRPKDINDWTIIEKLDLEKKAILSMQENFHKHPHLSHITIPSEEIQKTLADLHQFNETMIQQYNQQLSSRNNQVKSGSHSNSISFPQSSSFLSSLLPTSSFATSL